MIPKFPLEGGWARAVGLTVARRRRLLPMALVAAGRSTVGRMAVGRRLFWRPDARRWGARQSNDDVWGPPIVNAFARTDGEYLIRVCKG